MTFHRANFWVFGRKMAKADLTYLVQPNQKVSLECSEITEQVSELVEEGSIQEDGKRKPRKETISGGLGE